MLSLIKRYRDLILVAGLLLFPFATFMTRGPQGRDPMMVDRGLISLSSYVQRAFAWVLDGSASVWNGYAALRGVEAENKALREENQALKSRAQGLESLRAENDGLRAILAYQEKSPGPRVVAKVVGVDPSSTRHAVRIDRGASDHVESGMAVITVDGVAGYVERVTSSTADVILITDATSRMGVSGERSGKRAIATGTGNKNEVELRLDFALRKDDFQEGDVMVTSGTDGIYPRGLKVGTLSRVERKSSGMFQGGVIRPAVDPGAVQEVMVLPRVEVGPPQAAPPTRTPPPVQGTGGAGTP